MFKSTTQPSTKTTDALETLQRYGAEYFGGRTFKVAFGDTLDQDVFAGCQKVEVYGYAAGDIYAGCETVVIEGKVEDDVLIAVLLHQGGRRLELRG